MDVDTLQFEVEQLTEALRGFGGYRSVWRSPDGELVHSEPDEELELEGYRLLATLMRPDRDTVTAALMAAEPPRPLVEARVDVGWERTAVPAELVPAHA